MLDRIPPGIAMNIEREVFPGMVTDGVMAGMATGGWWSDIGTPSRYLEANLEFLRRVAPPTGWLAGEGARIDGGATVVESVVGAGCLVADGATVRGSVLLDGVTVGAGAWIDGAVIGGGTTVAASAKLGPGTVIGFDELVT